MRRRTRRSLLAVAHRAAGPPSAVLALLAHPLLQGAVLLALCAVIAKPARPIGRAAGLVLAGTTLLLLALLVSFAA